MSRKHGKRQAPQQVAEHKPPKYHGPDPDADWRGGIVNAPAVYWRRHENKWSGCGLLVLFALIAPLIAGVLSFHDVSFSSSMLWLSVLWALPSLWLMLSPARLRFADGKIWLKEKAFGFERDIEVGKGDVIRVVRGYTKSAPDNVSTPQVEWAVMREPKNEWPSRICASKKYADMRFVAKAICRVTGLSLGCVEDFGALKRDRISGLDVDLPYRTRLERYPFLDRVQKETKSVGIGTSSTRDGATVLTWSYMRDRISWSTCGWVTLGVAVVWFIPLEDGGSLFTLFGWTGLAFLATLAAITLALVMLCSARLIVSPREIRHQMLVAGIPYPVGRLQTPLVEEMDLQSETLVLSDHRNTIEVRTWEDDDRTNRDNAEWLATQIRHVLFTVQPPAEP